MLIRPSSNKFPTILPSLKNQVRGPSLTCTRPHRGSGIRPGSAHTSSQSRWLCNCMCLSCRTGDSRSLEGKKEGRKVSAGLGQKVLQSGLKNSEQCTVKKQQFRDSGSMIDFELNFIFQTSQEHDQKGHICLHLRGGQHIPCLFFLYLQTDRS